MTRQMQADWMLMIITAFWGMSYVLTKVGLEWFQPFNLTALRFVIAFAVSAAVFHPRIAGIDRKTLVYAFILAVILFAVFGSMSFGIQRTTASNAGFLINMAVVLIPILSYVCLRQKIAAHVLAGVCLALAGTGLLTLNGEWAIGLGDLLCLLCALLFAGHVVVTGIFTRQVDSIALAVLQLGFVGLLCTVFSLGTETVRLPDTLPAWLVVLSLSILCTAVGYVVQTFAQQYTSATHAGLIMSLEPVYSAVGAYLFLGEVLSPQGYAGAAILLSGVLLSELGGSWRPFRKRSTVSP